MVKIDQNAVSPKTSSQWESDGHEIAARAATPEWLAIGVACVGVRESPGSIHGEIRLKMTLFIMLTYADLVPGLHANITFW